MVLTTRQSPWSVSSNGLSPATRQYVGMPTTPSARSVKIDQDEKGGWSSDRPRRDDAPPRPANLSVRCRILRPANEVRYSPGSLLLIASSPSSTGEALAQRVVEDKASVLSMAKVRGLLEGRVSEEEIAGKATELLDAAVAKRLGANASVTVVLEGMGPEERERFARPAAAVKRPCHLVLVESPREQVEDEQRPALNKLRKALDAGELGAEGFNTAMRLGGDSATELKRIVFRPEPKDE